MWLWPAVLLGCVWLAWSAEPHFYAFGSADFGNQLICYRVISYLIGRIVSYQGRAP